MKNRCDRLFPVFVIGCLCCILVLHFHDHNDDGCHPAVHVNILHEMENKALVTYRDNRMYPIRSSSTLKTARSDKRSLKYLLIYTPDINPFHLLQKQQNSFIDNKCEYTNCYVTTDKSLLKDLRDFDALLFSGVFLREMRKSDLPKSRSLTQKYVFATLESAPLHPVTNPVFDNFFNWTWTYRLDSDISWRYITIYNLNGEVIGPTKDMIWPINMDPTTDQVKNKLKYKSKAVAWFVSHCKTQSRREKFVSKFKQEFRKYGWSVDVYGSCGNRVCGQRCSKFPNCLEMLEKDYYFYFSFENSLEQDYITEKLMIALNHYIVPVVLGGGNYSWFLPPGSYLDARVLGPRNLARIMNDAIKNSTLYYEFFKWRNHFKYKSTEETTGLCDLCKALNDEDMMKTTTHSEFRLWWNGPIRQKTYDFVLKKFMDNDELLELAATYNFSRANSLILLNSLRNQSIIRHVNPLKTEFNSSTNVNNVETLKMFTAPYVTNVIIPQNDSTENFDTNLLPNNNYYNYSVIMTTNESFLTPNKAKD